MKRRVALIVIALVGSLLIAIPEAQACSCMANDPRDSLHANDGAFSGTYVGREPVDLTDPYAEWDYVFETDKVYKGDIGETIEVRAPADGAGCGLEYSEGQAAALFVYTEEGVWYSDLCRTVPPELLEIAAAPFPEPDAEGPPVALVGGSFGEVRVIAVDGQGRTAGYGYGEGDALHMSLCPGGERSIEMVGAYLNDEQRSVDVRRLSDLKVQTTTLAPDRWLDEFAFPVDAVCTSEAGSAVVFSRGFADDTGYTELTRFEDGSAESILRSKARHGAVGTEYGFLGKRKKITKVDLVSGEQNPLRVFGQRVSHLALSPDNTRLALIVGARAKDGKLLVLRTADGKVTARRELTGQSTFAKLEWADDESLLFWGLTRNAPLYSRSLRVKATVRDWFPENAVADGCTLYGAAYGVLIQASACEGGTGSVLREFFSPVTYSVLELPDGTEIDAPPQS